MSSKIFCAYCTKFLLTFCGKYDIIMTISGKEGEMPELLDNGGQLSMSDRLEVTPEELDYSLDYFNITDDYGANEEEWR